MVDARRYHEETNHTPRRLQRATHTMDERIRPRPFKAYVDREAVSLPAIAPPDVPALEAVATPTATPAGVGGGAPLDLTRIATVCHLAAGITQETGYKGEEVRFRAASCTGNLHHIDLYLVAGARPDLDAGVYHFDPTAVALDVLRSGDHRGTVARATGGGAVADAPLTVVVTSTWWRNAWKYQARTYRHAFWDGGTVIANLLAGAHGLGVAAEVVSAFADDTLCELVGVDPAEEAPIAAVAVGTGDPAPDAAAHEPIDPATAPLSSERIEYPLIVDAWEQSRLADGAAAATWRETCRSAGPIGRVDPGGGDRVELDPVDRETASGRPLLETVNRRGSKRRFTEAGPTRRQVGTVLDRATRGVPADWAAGGAAGPRHLDCYVLATGVRGVPDGRYQYHPSTDALERLGDTSAAVKAELALNQPWAGEAHLNVYLMADVGAIVDRLGNRGYRLAQLEAGITLGRLYLAAAAHRDLGGTGLTFFDGHVTDHLGPRAAGQAPMTLFALGRVDPDAGTRL